MNDWRLRLPIERRQIDLFVARGHEHLTRPSYCSSDVPLDPAGQAADGSLGFRAEKLWVNQNRSSREYHRLPSMPPNTMGVCARDEAVGAKCPCTISYGEKC